MTRQIVNFTIPAEIRCKLLCADCHELPTRVITTLLKAYVRKLASP